MISDILASKLISYICAIVPCKRLKDKPDNNHNN